jgi:DNA-directed RNA polymerase specialized sigma24 family protein
MRGEEIQQITEFVESALPAHEARAVAERYGYGHTTTDAAKRMCVKERTVSRYLCIGLRRIRQAVGALEIEEGVCR